MDKKHIISEIHRTTKENNGKPLGSQSFTHTTGVKRSDWLGKYWARWGDALREAGYQANKFQGSYDIDYLCEKYVSLTRELGHVPVEAELRMKARSDKSFPSTPTFGRLGSKYERLTTLLRFCETHQEYKDVLVIYENAVPSASKPHETIEKSTTQDGYVYLIQSGRYYKIGYTKDIQRRSKEIAIELPERATTIHVITTDDPSGIEAYWHNRFKNRRANGEWFTLTPADVKAFRRRKFM